MTNFTTRRFLMCLLIVMVVLCAPTALVQAKVPYAKSAFDVSKGRIDARGLLTVKDTRTGTVMTVTNCSHFLTQDTKYDWYYSAVAFRNSGSTTITFKFSDPALSLRSIQYWAATKWGGAGGYGYKYPFGNKYNKVENFTKTVDPVTKCETWTCTFSGVNNLEIYGVALWWDPKEEILANPPQGVEKEYTGSSLNLVKYDDDAYTTSWSGAYYKCKYETVNWAPNTLMYKREGADASSSASAKDKGSYTFKWWYKVAYNYFLYNTGTWDEMYTRAYGSETAPLGTFTSRIIGLQLTDVVEPVAKELVYTGEPQTLITAATSSNGKGCYWMPGESGWSDVLPERTEAGTYKVYWYVKSNKAVYEDWGGMSDATRKGPVEVTIAKVDIPEYTAPTALTQVFNQSQLPLVSAGSATGGTVLYRLGTDGEWQESVPTAMPVGDYNIYWYVRGDNNHNDKLADGGEPFGPIVGKVVQASYDMSGAKWQGQSTLVYDGVDHQSQLSIVGSSLPAGVSVTSYTMDAASQPVSEAVNAGSYTVTAHFTTSSANYTAPADMSTTLTIQPFNLLNAYVSGQIESQVYDATAQTPALPALKVSIDGITIPVSAFTTVYANNTNAGQATATVYANGSDGNYTGSNALTFTIQKHPATVTTHAQTISYGDVLSSKNSEATLSGQVEGHALSSLRLSADASLGIGIHEKAIQATEVYIEDADHNDVTANYDVTCPEDSRGTLTINQKVGDGFIVSGLNDEYEGDGEHAVTPDVSGATEVAVYDGTMKLIKGTDYDVTYTSNTKAGEATATFQFKGNYSGSVQKTFKIYYEAETFSRSLTPAYNYCTYYNKDEKLYVKSGEGDVFFCTLNDAKTDVVLTAVTDNIINAGVPVMLRSSATTKAVKLYATTHDDVTYSGTGTNALTGVGSSDNFPADKEVTSTDKIFIFDGEGFVWATSGELVAHHAFINGSNRAGGMNLVGRSLSISSGEGTTGIVEAELQKNHEETAGQWYDLSGRKLQGKPSAKGLYIKNGVKVVVK